MEPMNLISSQARDLMRNPNIQGRDFNPILHTKGYGTVSASHDVPKGSTYKESYNTANEVPRRAMEDQRLAVKKTTNNIF